MKQDIYLDNNATTPVDPAVIEAVCDDLKYHFGNPSSTHAFGQDSRSRLIKARDQIARYLKVKSSEIVFVSSGTEAMNMLIRGVLLARPGAHVITSNIEHSCVYATLNEQENSQVTYLSPGRYGAITPETLLKAIQPQTQLITLMAVNNETGVKTDITEIAKIAEARSIPFVVDGVAWLGKENISIPPGVSAIGFSGHKIHAPKGVGFAFIRSRLKMAPLLFGGDQEYGRRGGTENMPGIIGLAKAIEILEKEAPFQRIKALKERFEEKVLQALPKVIVNGEGPRSINTSNLLFTGVEGETLLRLLNERGVAASHGSACSSGALEPSRILLNMGLTMEEAKSSLRFSFSRMNSEEEIDAAVAILVHSVQELRRLFAC